MAALILLAGCTSVPSGGSPEAQSPEGATTQPATISTETAKDRALNAEKNRVRRILENKSNITSSVGIYGTTNAKILNKSDEGIHIQVTMSYSYEYDCGERDGNVDGATTKTVYHVTNNSTKLIDVEQEVNIIC